MTFTLWQLLTVAGGTFVLGVMAACWLIWRLALDTEFERMAQGSKELRGRVMK